MKSGKLLLGAIVGLATLTACGGGGGANQAAGNPPPAESGAVSVRAVDGVGQTLVDAAGKTLYFADQEAGGTIKCTASCLGFWMPVAGSADAAKAMDGLGVVKRTDTGNDQLTYQGKPLYTFSLDNGPGQGKGNNVQDAFAGTTFTWHAATTTAAAPTKAPSTTGGGGYGY